jgi:hypothetical protein
MKRWSPVLPLVIVVLLAACATTRPPVPDPDPVTDPTVVGAVDEAARQAAIEGREAARTGRRIGRVAGVFAAVLGGSEHESLDETIDRYRLTRDAIEATALIIGARHGAAAGAKRGFVFDQQFAELHALDGVDVIRPVPDEIDAYLGSAPSDELLASVAADSFTTRGNDRLDGVVLLIRYRA